MCQGALPDLGHPALCPPHRELSREPHLSSTPRDEELVQLLLQRWQDAESGLDSAETFEYEVLLSLPSQEQPNSVTVGECLFRFGEARGAGELLGPALTLPALQWIPLGTSSSPAAGARRT